MYYYRDAARFRLRYLIMQPFRCSWNATPGLSKYRYYSRFSSYNGVIVEERVKLRLLIRRSTRIRLLSLLFLSNYSPPASSECINATRIALFPDSKWRFSTGCVSTAEETEVRSDDSDGREWFQLLIIAMCSQVRRAFARTFLPLSRNECWRFPSIIPLRSPFLSINNRIKHRIWIYFDRIFAIVFAKIVKFYRKFRFAKKLYGGLGVESIFEWISNSNIYSMVKFFIFAVRAIVYLSEDASSASISRVCRVSFLK